MASYWPPPWTFALFYSIPLAEHSSNLDQILISLTSQIIFWHITIQSIWVLFQYFRITVWEPIYQGTIHYFQKGPATPVGVKNKVQNPLITLWLFAVQGFFWCNTLQPFLNYKPYLGPFYLSYQLIKKSSMMCYFVPIHGPPYFPTILLLCGASCNTNYWQIDLTLRASLHTSSDDLVATIKSSK